MKAALAPAPWKPPGNAVNAEHQDNIESKASDANFKKLVLEGKLPSCRQQSMRSAPSPHACSLAHLPPAKLGLFGYLTPLCPPRVHRTSLPANSPAPLAPFSNA